MLEDNVPRHHINIHMQEKITVVVVMVAAGINVAIQHLLLIAFKMSLIVNGSIQKILVISKLFKIEVRRFMNNSISDYLPNSEILTLD